MSDSTDSDDKSPVRLGYRGVMCLDDGDEVLYRTIGPEGPLDDIYTPVKILATTGRNATVRFLQDHHGNTYHPQGQSVIVNHDELHWDPAEPFPFSKLKKLLAA